MPRFCRALGFWSLCIAVLAAGGCDRRQPAPPVEPPAVANEGADEIAPARPSAVPVLAPRRERRGLGSVTARVPGTSEVVEGVRVASHHVSVVVRDGFARTEIEEELANDSPRVLEGRYVFPVPPDASLSRLALWVDKELVEGEIVERDRAARIFQSIVDDTVRPRDPALLEWTRGSELSLKIFPIPAKGSRKVVLAYDQVLRQKHGRTRYVYPLSLGMDVKGIDDFAIRLTGTLGDPTTPGFATTVARGERGLGVSFQARSFQPSADFVMAFDEPSDEGAANAVVPASHVTVARAPGDRFVAVRVPIEAPAGVESPSRARRDRAVIVDVSHSQSRDTLAGEIAIAEGVIRALDPDERFVLLACESACTSFPEDGLAMADGSAFEAARVWLDKRVPGGSSDIAGALLAAAKRLDPGGSGQVVMIGDGAPTSGELSAEGIAARVRPEIQARDLDVRLLGAGRTVDSVVLEGLGRALGASYERLGDGEPLAQRVDDLAASLRVPLLRDVSIAASAGLRDVYPRVLPSVRLGEEVLVLARMEAGATGEVRVAGELAGAPYSKAKAVRMRDESPVVPRLWAAARIAELEASQDASANAEVIALSKRHHVLSRRTSLLVLENDRMFAAFGIPRTQGAQKAAEDGPSVAAIGGASTPSSEPPLTLDFIGTIGHGAGTGASFGAGHGRLSGVGEGGGGRGDKIGEVATPADGFGAGMGRLSGEHATRVPRVRMGATSVSGRLPPEVIQRIVRQQFGRLRLCYENGLRVSPSLAGRVSVRFVIDREGNVAGASNGGSDMPDPLVVACVVRAFSGLRFPAPEGGVVSVTYPVMFSPDGGTPSTHGRAMHVGPTASHTAGDDRWMTRGDGAIQQLADELAKDSANRRRHEALIRGLLRRGLFGEAFVAAGRFVEMDPDSGRALGLYAGAAAAAEQAAGARTALDSIVEITPGDVEPHLRAARAFEAAGDEARACAHWRSIASIQPRSDEARVQAWRCRARLGEVDGVVAEISAVDKPAKAIAALREALSSGAAPGYDAAAASAGSFEATVRCADESARCPVVVVVKPDGTVVSPWSPSSARVSARSVALAGGLPGTYRTVLLGGAADARGEVVVRAHDVTRTFRFEPGHALTVASTVVTGGWGGGFR